MAKRISQIVPALGAGELHLSQKEFDLLACLMQNRGIALSREALLE